MATAVGNLIAAAGIALRDTSVHTYRTDPTLLALLPLGDAQPPLRCYGVWIYNATNQPLTVQVIGNTAEGVALITGLGTPAINVSAAPPDYTIGSAQTVAAGATALFVGTFSSLPTDFIAVSLQASVAPTTGAVFALLKYYF